jgi:two-component system, NtrC family, sensor histidine kinase KinB
MTLRRRITFAMLPLLALLIALGGTGAILIYDLGNQLEKILRENYDSVVYMRNLNEALERVDSSFQFALAGREEEAHRQYEANWKAFSTAATQELGNITLPGEREMADRLAKLGDDYRKLGDKLYAAPPDQRKSLYFGVDPGTGLYRYFRDIKQVSGDILRINEQHMENTDREVRRLARSSLFWYICGLAAGIAVALLLIGGTIRTILYPIRAVTESALAIGEGNLDQLVPITSDDELGQLAQAFNSMTRQLREFRQSHQAKLLRAQQTSQATIDSFPDPVLVIDPQQRVEMANPAARRLLSVGSPHEAGRVSVPWEPPEPLREPLREVLQNQRPYLPEGFDKAIVLRLGEENHSCLPRILPIRDPSGATLGAAVLLEDVTRFRLLDEVKSNLVATVSHELKTPLTGLRLVLHLLLEETVGPLAPKQIELLVDARDNAERLLVMIDNLLDLARLEQGRSQLRVQPHRPAELLRAAADAFEPRAADRGVQLAVEVGDALPEVAVDTDQFQHALHNLLDNALVHTPQGGRITLGAEPGEREVVFYVADTGSGIPAEFLPMVFERYFRVPGDARPGGSGLGLAIVREIAAAHGGTVSCESIPGQRTVFRIAIPSGLRS